MAQAVKDYSVLVTKYESWMEEAYGIILGQYISGMMSKLEQRNDWKNVRDNHDSIELLTAIKEVSHNTEDHQYESGYYGS
jgi:hypothetical protein